VWTQHGVLTPPLPVEMVTALSINNFNELLEFRDRTLTEAERLPADDVNWQSPLTGTAATYNKVSVSTAWQAQLNSFKQAPADMSRQRNTAERITAVAADVALGVAMADRVKGLSLSSVTNRAAAHKKTGQVAPTASRIVAILSQHGDRYKVRWSQPEGNPEVTKEKVSWLDQHADYALLAQQFKQQQQQQPEQPEHQQQEQQTQETEQAEESQTEPAEELEPQNEM